MNIIENTATRVSTNLGETPALQIANGVKNFDPDEWVAGRYAHNDRVLASDGNIYQLTQNPNKIPIAGSDDKFETMRELALRIANPISGSFNAISVNNNVGSNTLPLDITYNISNVNQETLDIGYITGRITVTGNKAFTWDGRYNLGFNENSNSTPIAGMAEPVSGQGTASQVWRIDNVELEFSKFIYIVLNPLDVAGGQSLGLGLEFDGKIDYVGKDFVSALRDIYTYQDPKHLFTRTEDGVGYREGDIIEPIEDILPDGREFLADITWWTRIRAKAEDSFFDEKPAVGIGRMGAVQVNITSPTPFDSVALVNCECLEAEVAGNMLHTCRVQGVDNTTSFSNVNFGLSLTCIDTAPNTGTGRLDGVITLNNDTNFTWDGVARSVNENPLNLVATRAPNDGADDAMVQHWIVKDAVFDFTRVGFISINNVSGNAIDAPNFTGSFEGVVSYEGNTTITLSPDAPHEPSDLLFTDLQPIANDAGIYTAIINIRADSQAIPTSSQTASGRQTASIGQIVVGMKTVLGTTDANSISKSLLDFSTIERLPEGDFDVFKRHATYEINSSTQYPAKNGQKVQRIIHALTPAKPAFFYVPDFVSDDESEGEPLGAGMYLYGIIELASFGVDSENEPSVDAGELVELKIGGLV